MKEIFKLLPESDSRIFCHKHLNQTETSNSSKLVMGSGGRTQERLSAGTDMRHYLIFAATFPSFPSYRQNVTDYL